MNTQTREIWHLCCYVCCMLQSGKVKYEGRKKQSQNALTKPSAGSTKCSSATDKKETSPYVLLLELNLVNTVVSNYNYNLTILFSYSVWL